MLLKVTNIYYENNEEYCMFLILKELQFNEPFCYEAEINEQFHSVQ